MLLQKRYDEALAAFEQMRQMAPHASSANLGIGQVYLAKGEYDKALKAIMADFKSAGITYYWLGGIYAAQGDRAKALEAMQKPFKPVLTTSLLSTIAPILIRYATTHNFRRC